MGKAVDHEVSMCAACPFFMHEGLMGISMCTLDKYTRNPWEDPLDTNPPSWCDLRERDHVVKLRLKRPKEPLFERAINRMWEWILKNRS